MKIIESDNYSESNSWYQKQKYMCIEYESLCRKRMKYKE